MDGHEAAERGVGSAPVGELLFRAQYPIDRGFRREVDDGVRQPGDDLVRRVIAIGRAVDGGAERRALAARQLVGRCGARAVPGAAGHRLVDQGDGHRARLGGAGSSTSPQIP